MSAQTSVQKSDPSSAVKPAERGLRNLKGRGVVVPPVDIYENAEEYLLVLDLPGVPEDKVNVRLDHGEMLVEASRVEEDLGKVLGSECPVLDYRRAFVLPDEVNPDGIQAVLARGVLSIHIPKAASALPRRIEVKAGA
jgi:HSP20 family molecular chaperone IbpA